MKGARLDENQPHQHPGRKPLQSKSAESGKSRTANQDENRQTRNFIRSQTTFGKVFHSQSNETNVSKQLKAQVEAGTYKVDADQLAANLVKYFKK